MVVASNRLEKFGWNNLKDKPSIKKFISTGLLIPVPNELRGSPVDVVEYYSKNPVKLLKVDPIVRAKVLTLVKDESRKLFALDMLRASNHMISAPLL